MYSGFGIELNGVDLWKFGNENVRNVVNFGADNSSSSHGDKNNFLVLGEGPTYGINRNFGAPERKV